MLSAAGHAGVSIASLPPRPDSNHDPLWVTCRVSAFGNSAPSAESDKRVEQLALLRFGSVGDAKDALLVIDGVVQIGALQAWYRAEGRVG